MSDFQCKFYLLDGAETLECKDGNHPSLAEAAHGFEHVFQTVRCVGVVNPPSSLFVEDITLEIICLIHSQSILSEI